MRSKVMLWFVIELSASFREMFKTQNEEKYSLTRLALKVMPSDAADALIFNTWSQNCGKRV